MRLRHARQAIGVVRVEGEGAAVMLLRQLELAAIDMHLAQDAVGNVIRRIQLRCLARMGEGLRLAFRPAVPVVAVPVVVVRDRQAGIGPRIIRVIAIALWKNLRAFSTPRGLSRCR